ncbi:DUF3565 domain-containing protein [Sorangium sp. So ce1128]
MRRSRPWLICSPRHTSSWGDRASFTYALSCGHGQHVRHTPPFTLRPWVLTPEGRASMLGTELDCVRCDRLEMPDGLIAYSRTAEFDEGSIPGGLKSTSFGIDINRPSGAPSGPIPLLISLAGFGSITLDSSVFSANGVATAIYNNDEIGAQGGGGTRGTGKFYDLYGRNHAASSMIAWA